MSKHLSRYLSNEGEELQRIYAVLRKLKAFGPIKDPSSSTILDESTFPRRFLYKLLDERMAGLADTAIRMAPLEFKRIAGRQKSADDATPDESPKSPPDDNLDDLGALRFPHFDEYFHNCFYWLYDFLIELDWHESDVELIGNADSKYIKANLLYYHDYLEFQTALASNSAMKSALEVKMPQAKSGVITKSSSPVGPVKSSLASFRSDSPKRQQRRVRFKPSKAATESEPAQTTNDKIRKENHSILALKLLLYSIDVYLQFLCSNLANWAQTTSLNVKSSLEQIVESRQRVRTTQLRSIVARIKHSNNAYLGTLSCLAEVRQRYIFDQIIGIVCARDNEHVLNQYKLPLLRAYVNQIGANLEKRLLDKLVEQNLQVLFDLMLSEINLPPLELEPATRNRSRDELLRSQENQSNFIMSWLNVDELLYGPRQRKQQQPKVMDAQAARNAPKKVSTLADSGQFKSSSRILAQMGNLKELMRVLLREITERIESNQQIAYLLDSLYIGVELAFETLAPKLKAQLKAGRKSGAKVLKSPQSDPLESLERSVDSIAAKIRCLKFIEIMTSLDELLRETSSAAKVRLNDRSLDAKLREFTEQCANQSETAFVVTQEPRERGSRHTDKFP